MRNKVTGVCVLYNTKDLFTEAFTSIRQYHPDFNIILIDGSPVNSDCYTFVQKLSDPNLMKIQVGYNIGHGRGMCAGVYYVTTPYVLFFDSDIVMLKSPIDQMLSMMTESMFGIGRIENVGSDGFPYGTHGFHKSEKPIPYLHPYFQLVQVSVYRKFPSYMHHGAPCILTMRDIFYRGESDFRIKHFDGIDSYVKHRVAGTRKIRRSAGLSEIEGKWNRI